MEEQKTVSFAQVLDLKDDPALIEEYKKQHTQVWPEVLRALHTVGVRKMKIFLSGTHLFMYYEAHEGFDPSVDFQRYTSLTPRAAEWDKWMITMQQKVKEAKDSEWWSPAEEVFDLQSQLAALPPLDTDH
eukprot:TRINITY_DN4308_c0_g1_i2.p1 TRINITY_DN4308_c0_g1~~TRINITY_DN4308_c0_g1_i2.p1  ORF type:complete len:138 (+),score=42.54 TRINITY_DN4308_c0_g1_i2:25-414(+)